MPNGTTSRAFNLKGDPISLGHVWSGTSVTFNYAYDRSRKLTSKAVTNAAFGSAGPAVGSVAYTLDKLNRYGTVGGAVYSYDAAGNLTSDGTSTFGYDAENRLLSATTPLGSGAYTYDPLGRRIGKGVGGGAPTAILPAGDDEIAAYNSTGTLLRRWVPSPEIDRLIAQVDVASASTTFFRLDRQGSTVAMTNTAGAMTEGPYTYDGYGKPNLTTGTPFRYTGRKYDAETGLYYYRARYYSPTLGRFLQTDSVGYEDGLNWYAYVGNDPLNAGDPSGTLCSSTVGCEIADLRTLPAITPTSPQAGIREIAANPAGFAVSAVRELVGGVLSGFGAGAPAGASLGSAAARVESAAPKVAAEIGLSRAVHGEAATHAADALAAGKPSVLTIDRGGAAANRAASLRSIPKVPGQHLDEYPPAMFREGGQGASVRAINPRDNMSAGACVGNACRGLPNGAQVRIRIDD